jgi:hypothetical protein
MLTMAGMACVFAGTEPEMQQTAKPQDENSHNLLNY